MSHITFNLTPIGDVVKASKSGRKCKFTGCKVTLNIYNHGQYCNVHKRKLWDSGNIKLHRFMKGDD
jgi:hypothetical protein